MSTSRKLTSHGSSVEVIIEENDEAMENLENVGSDRKNLFEKYQEMRSPDKCMEVMAAFEMFPDGKARKVFKFMYAGLALSLLSLIVAASMKFSGRYETTDDGVRYNRANACIAGVFFVTSATCAVMYGWRAARLYFDGHVWTRRRKIFVAVHFIQLTSQAINSFCHFLPNLVVAIHEPIDDGKWDDLLEACGYIRISMWNNIFFLLLLQARLMNLWVDEDQRPIGKPDSMLVDAPLSKHWYLAIWWLAFEVIPVTGAIYGKLNESSEVVSETCVPDKKMLLIGGAFSSFVVIYQVSALFFLYKGLSQLKKKPYTLFRDMNVGLRYHFMQVGAVGDFITLSFVLLYWIKVDACSSGHLTWFGLIPPQFAMTILSVVNCILLMPMPPIQGQESNMSTQLAWNELDAQKEALRGDDHKFCFESAIKLWYWSLAVYEYDHDTGKCDDPDYPSLNMEHAMQLYNLCHLDFISEGGVNLVVSWSDCRVVISFRGTYSIPNVWSDLQFLRVPHPPNRGMYLMRTQAMVHRGFLEVWLKLKDKVLSKVGAILGKPGGGRMDVIITGHSLGGALAILASYDIKTSCKVDAKHIMCYTFGAPRVGNHAFVKDYNSEVPNTWQIINDRDLISRMPKFWILFKHAGNRMIMNESGDMIVSPLYVELALYNPPSLYKKAASIRQHLMLNYRKSFVAVIEAQYITHKGIPGGRPAMRSLLEVGPTSELIPKALDLKIGSFRQIHALGSLVWRNKKEMARKTWSNKVQKFLRSLGLSSASTSLESDSDYDDYVDDDDDDDDQGNNPHSYKMHKIDASDLK